MTHFPKISQVLFTVLYIWHTADACMSQALTLFAHVGVTLLDQSQFDWVPGIQLPESI